MTVFCEVLESGKGCTRRSGELRRREEIDGEVERLKDHCHRDASA